MRRPDRGARPPLRPTAAAWAFLLLSAAGMIVGTTLQVMGEPAAGVWMIGSLAGLTLAVGVLAAVTRG